MLHAGLDLSRNRLDVCLLSEHGEPLEEFRVASDHDGVRGLARRVLGHGEPVRAVIESMTGARFVHDTLERYGWDVLIADALKVKGLAPLACKTDEIDARVLAVLSERDPLPAIWLPDPPVRREREPARFRLHLVKHRSMLKHRIHSTLMTAFGRCRSGRPWRRARGASGTRPASLVWTSPAQRSGLIRVEAGDVRCSGPPLDVALLRRSRGGSDPPSLGPVRVKQGGAWSRPVDAPSAGAPRCGVRAGSAS
jgi:transposase